MRGGATATNLANASGVAPIVNGGTGSAMGFTGANQLLFKLTAANMQLTTDQAFTKLFTGTNYVITHVFANTASGGTSVACAGGIYTAAAKAGSALIAAVQSWVTLTAAGKIVNAALAAVVGTDLQSATPILSLTTGSTAAATADIYIFGAVIS